MLYDIQKKMIDEKGKPFKHDDDHYYYIIHPDHIKNYIVFQNDTQCDNSTGNCSGNSNETNSSMNYTKTFVFNYTEERNETIVIPSGNNCKNDSKNNSDNNHTNDDGNNILERKSITFHDFDNSLPFPNDLIVTHEFQNVSNTTKPRKQNSKIKIKEENSGKFHLIYFYYRRGIFYFFLEKNIFFL